MAPFNTRGTADVLSTQVVSHNESSIVVEAGGFVPMRWFLEHGNPHADSDDETKNEGPPKKRRKTGKTGKTVPAHFPNTKVESECPSTLSPSPVETIPLAKVTLDFNFPNRENVGEGMPQAHSIAADVDFADEEGIPVIVYGMCEDHTGSYMRIAHPHAQGAVLKMDITKLPDSLMNELRMIALPGRQKQTWQGQASKDHPATITKCVLTRSRGSRYNIVRLEASILWRDGVSAFPSGVPIGKSRVYGDYDLKAQFFPDSGRDGIDHTRAWSPQDFYESVHVPTVEATPELNEVMETELYPFQQRAVKWMLMREGVRYVDGQIAKIPQSESRDSSIPCLLYTSPSPRDGLLSRMPSSA